MKSITLTTIDVWESHVGELNLTDATIEQMSAEVSARYTGTQPPHVVVQLSRMILSDLADAQLSNPRTLERHFLDAYARTKSSVEPWVADMNQANEEENSKECFAAEDATFMRRVGIVLKTVTCKFCRKEVPEATAHAHDGGWVGDECCWEERLRTTA